MRDSLITQAEGLRAEGASVMHLAVGGRLSGLLAVSDPVKASTPEALTALKAAGLRVVMATGDGVTTARAVASTTRRLLPRPMWASPWAPGPTWP